VKHCPKGIWAQCHPRRRTKSHCRGHWWTNFIALLWSRRQTTRTKTLHSALGGFSLWSQPISDRAILSPLSFLSFWKPLRKKSLKSSNCFENFNIYDFKHIFFSPFLKWIQNFQILDTTKEEHSMGQDWWPCKICEKLWNSGVDEMCLV